MSIESEIELTNELFFPQLKFSDSKQVLKYMAQQLVRLQFVKPEYESALIEREAEYPTGLPVAMPGIAIPHADYNLVNKTTLAVATLQTPVNFNNMEDTQQLLPVQIIIMMAIGEPHGQVTMLQKIVSIIQDDDFRNKLVKATTNTELYELLVPKLMINGRMN